jgi:hypothetical protein
MTITPSTAQAPKHRRFAAVMAAVLLVTALSGCVVRPIGYWGDDHRHYWHDRY